MLSFDDPLARTLTAEVWPDTALAAKLQEFKYFIRPSFATGNLGFDQVLIKTPTQAELMGVKNFGMTSLIEIKEKLTGIGLSLRSLNR